VHALGFTLIELMIVVAIIAILATIAYPSYISHVTKTNRVAAEGCLSELASYMERYYTTHLRYDQDASGTANPYPLPDCASSQRTGANYVYTPPGGANLTATSFMIMASPQGTQADRDKKCGTLTLNEAGKRNASGPGGTTCW